MNLTRNEASSSFRLTKFLLLLRILCLLATTTGLSYSLPPNIREVVVVKVGGSSITKKNKKETLDKEQIQWFADTLATMISDHFKALSRDNNQSTDQCEQNKNTAYVVIHGAGSFGHHQAKEHGLSGQKDPSTDKDEEMDSSSRRFQMEGLAKTRLSVQKLNRILIESLITAGINAVGISPCFAAPSLRADGSSEAAAQELRSVVESSLLAGIVPVLHGDACLYGTHTAGILSGDTLFQMLGIGATRGVFLTDVNGVYTADPKVANATFVPAIGVDGETGDLVFLEDDFIIAASESLHPEDTTGGFNTKLASALLVARSNTKVSIAKCGSDSAVNALRGMADSNHTVIFRID
eukprot:scaffold16707_cov182-Amphora_coffeaeformis.AAC.13